MYEELLIVRQLFDVYRFFKRSILKELVNEKILFDFLMFID